MMHGMPAMCENCPFRTDGAAIRLRPSRLDEIKLAVLIGQPFYCHKTTAQWRAVDADQGYFDDEAEDEMLRLYHPHWQECRGALDFRRDELQRDPHATERALAELLRDL